MTYMTAADDLVPGEYWVANFTDDTIKKIQELSRASN